jgi:hypothetical protein
MPIRQYYKGDGEKVMSSLKSRYGEKDGERAFYAIANKKGLNPPGKKKGTKQSAKKR